MPIAPALKARRPGANPPNVAVPLAPEDIMILDEAASLSGFNRAAWCRETLVSAALEFIAQHGQAAQAE